MNKENENQAMVSKGLSEKSGIKEVETTTSVLEKLNGCEFKTSASSKRVERGLLPFAKNLPGLWH